MREKETHNKILAPKKKYLKGTSFSTDYQKGVGQKRYNKKGLNGGVCRLHKPTKKGKLINK